MRVYNVIHRDDCNNEINCLGSFVNIEKAKERMMEKLEQFKTEITYGGVVNEVKFYDNEVSIDYNDSYVDIIKITENEVE